MNSPCPTGRASVPWPVAPRRPAAGSDPATAAATDATSPRDPAAVAPVAGEGGGLGGGPGPAVPALGSPPSATGGRQAGSRCTVVGENAGTQTAT